MNKGWAKIHRQIEDSGLWFSESFTKAQAWIDLFLFACHKDKSFWVRGCEVKLKRGQIGWSEVTMAKRWKWSRNKVRRYLKWLETEQQIEQQKIAKVTTIITICNYDKHQNDTTDDTTERQQTIQQTEHKQELKNVKNDKKREGSINYLKDLTDEDVETMQGDFMCNKNQIRNKAQSLIDYCESRGKRYKNYKAFLRNALRKDFGVRKKEVVSNKKDEEVADVVEWSRFREKVGDLANKKKTD